MALEGLERIAGRRVVFAAGRDLIAIARQRALKRSQIRRARRRRGPEADARFCELAPVEELAGIGLWPAADSVPDGARAESSDFAADMRRYGYENDSADSIAAFQRHFRPAAVTGIADAQTKGRLRSLIIQAGLA